MSAQFHTPSFGDEVVYELSDHDTATSGTAAVNVIGNNNFLLQQQPQLANHQQQQLQSKRMRNMDQSLDEYHSANDDSFGNNTSGGAVGQSGNTTTTLAARKQMSSCVDTNEPAKPLSAYGLFFRDTVSAIKQQNPNCPFQELSRIVASMWDALDVSHRNVYNKKHETALSEYMKQLRIYRQQQEEQQQQQQQLCINNESSNVTAVLQSKPAVFTIQQTTQVQQQHQQPQQQQQQPIANTHVSVQQQQHAHVAPQINNAATTTAATTNDPAPNQVQILTETDTVQKCTRENCNKRAIINPDWEDEYCSNECVVVHCRNVFNAWVQSNLESRKQ